MRPRTYEGARLHAQRKAVDRDRHYPVIGLTQGRGRIGTALSRATWTDAFALAAVALVIACGWLA